MACRSELWSFAYSCWTHYNWPSWRMPFIIILSQISTIHQPSHMQHGVLWYLHMHVLHNRLFIPIILQGHLLVTSITDLLVRYIFGKRLWRLTDRNWLLAISVAGVSLFVFGCGMAFAIRAFRIRAFADTGEISWLLYSSLGAGVIADCLIAISLCVWLLRIRTGFKRTDSLLNVLMLYSINTGMVTSLCAIVCFATYAITPNRFYYVATSFVLSKLNVNCLLASLNARSPLRDQMCRSPTGSFVTNTGGSEEDGAQSTPSSLVVRVDIVTDKNTSPLEDQHAKYCLV